jgi:hypothetical protein
MADREDPSLQQTIQALNHNLHALQGTVGGIEKELHNLKRRPSTAQSWKIGLAAGGTILVPVVAVFVVLLNQIFSSAGDTPKRSEIASMSTAIRELPTRRDIDGMRRDVHALQSRVIDVYRDMSRREQAFQERVGGIYELLQRRERGAPEDYQARLDNWRRNLTTPVGESFLGPPMRDRDAKQAQIRTSTKVPPAAAINLPPSKKLVAVLAMEAGEVVKLEEEREPQGTFWTVEIEHDLGFRTYYGHLKEPKVKLHQAVLRGQEIASTLSSSPVCLRIGIVMPEADTPSDPLPWLPPAWRAKAAH